MKNAKLGLFDYLQVFENKYILLASKISCGVWRIDFQDLNERESINEILQEKDNYYKLLLS